MGFGAYIHIPYCVKKCPYCDFNSFGVGKLIPEEEYTECVIREIGLYGEALRELEVDTVFFGGGTPSLFSPRSIGKVLESLFSRASPSPNMEVSLEANPKTADIDKLRGFREAGINRLSLGVQSFSPRKLEVLGRINSPDDGRRALEEAWGAGFSNLSMDLMFGVGGESLSEWCGDLREALSYEVPHVSCYCLTVEEDTPFAELYGRGALELPGDELAVSMLTLARSALTGAGYVPYEISNYARPGYECRHNLLYWRGESYLGLGAGAHSHASSRHPLLFGESPWGIRWANLRSPAQYMKSIAEHRKPLQFTEALTRVEALEDRLLMGLRLREGLRLGALEREFGMRLDWGELTSLSEEGYLLVSEGRLRFTEKGVTVSDELIGRIASAITPGRS